MRTCSSCWSGWASKAEALAFEPDAGLWEYRGRTRVHTYSAAMCWAGCNRLARDRGASRPARPRGAIGPRSRDRHPATLLERAWNEKRGAFHRRLRRRRSRRERAAAARDRPDRADDPRFVSTVAADRDGSSGAASTDALRERGRFRHAGDRVPRSAPSGSSTLVVARPPRGGARTVRDVLAHRNRYGLLSEDIDPQTGELWGNFPQTYSMVGPDPDGDAAVAKLGGPILARLIVVSNRVATPERDGSAPAASRSRSRRSASMRRRLVRLERRGRRRQARSPRARSRTAQRQLRRDRPVRGGLPGILQRLRQPGAVAGPALPARPDRVQPPRPHRLFPRQPALRHRAVQDPAARRHRLGARLSPDPASPRSCARAGTEPHRRSSCTCRFPPPEVIPVAAEPRTAAAAAPGIRPCRLPDRGRCRRFCSLPGRRAACVGPARLRSGRPPAASSRMAAARRGSAASRSASSPPSSSGLRAARRSLPSFAMSSRASARALVIGVDRLDYSQGPDPAHRGLRAVPARRTPSGSNKVTYLQIAPRSRSEIPRIFRASNSAVGARRGPHQRHVWRGRLDADPLPEPRPTAASSLAGLYRIARVGLVTPLRDGMNLVAKEYVAAQEPDDPGVLVLSRFAGAAPSANARCSSIRTIPTPLPAPSRGRSTCRWPNAASAIARYSTPFRAIRSACGPSTFCNR